MEIDGVKRLQAKLATLAEKIGAGVPVAVVGYTQRYAMAVHEVPARHAPGKQANYLLGPARKLANSGELNRVLRLAYKRTEGDLEEAVLTVAYRVLRDSQQVVPIDTSALKASGYACLEKDADSVAEAAFAESESIRLQVLAQRRGERVKKRKIDRRLRQLKRMGRKPGRKADRR